MNTRLHVDELVIDRDQVRGLVDSQFPEYAGLSLDPVVGGGSTNVLYRLGDDLLVRLPRQPGGTVSIEKEHRWLPVVGSSLPVAVPEVVALGRPGFGFGERWSIVRWLSGEPPRVSSPDEALLADRSSLARDLADVIVALRGLDVPEGAKSDPRLRLYRGGRLAEYDEPMRANIQRCSTIEGLDLDLDAALSVWQDAVALPGEIEAACWYHGDLVAENLLLDGGRLTGVLDFGGLGVGDPTIDLHGAWELFDAPARDVFRARLQVDDAAWLRGRAWALAVALMTLPYYWSTMPGRVQARLAMARTVLADALG